MLEDNKKRLEVKKNHHHVWARYMSRWSDNKRDVYYTTKHKKIRCDSVRNISVERNFYKISYLNSNHIEVIKKISALSNNPELQKAHMAYLEDFLKMQYLSDLYKESNCQDNELDSEILAWTNNSLENLHSVHEREVLDILDGLANRELSILDIDDNMVLFIQFLSQQFSRTKSLRDKVIAAQQKLHREEDLWLANIIKECWWLLSYFFGMNIGASLFNSRKEDTHCLLLNDTSIPFITSDQPVINAYQFLFDRIDPLEDHEFDLYYPITPTVAYMINQSNRFPGGEVVVSDETFVHEMNMEIAKAANVHLISNEATLLEKYQKYIGYRYNLLARSE